jgi:hypothetical protein
MAAAIAALVGLAGLAGQAAASTASLQKVSGKPTLVLVAKKREENVVYVTYQAGKKTLELRDKGSLPGYSDIRMTFDSAKSLPGCEFKRELDFFGQPMMERVICEVSKVKQVFVMLGDKDDVFFAGDQTYDSTKPRIPLFARGGKGNDQLIGGLGNDFLFGEAGRDIVEGSKGNDKISGGTGNDSLSGDEIYTSDAPPRKGGNDLIIGGAGKDYIYPGSGRDRVGAGAGNDLVSSVSDRDRDLVDCGAGRQDSLLGIDHRGYRFAEKGISGCETIGSGLFGNWTWSCSKKRGCLANATPFAAKEEEAGSAQF